MPDSEGGKNWLSKKIRSLVISYFREQLFPRPHLSLMHVEQTQVGLGSLVTRKAERRKESGTSPKVCTPPHFPFWVFRLRRCVVPSGEIVIPIISSLDTP